MIKKDINQLKDTLNSGDSQGKVEAAIQLLQKANTNIEDQIIKTAFEILISNLQDKKVEENVRSLASQQDNDWRVIILMSAFLRYRGEQNQSEGLLKSAFEKLNNNIDSLFSFLLKDWQLYTTWNIIAWFFIGLHLLNTKFLEIAEECCDKALEINKNTSESYYFKGMIYSIKTQYLIVKNKKAKNENGTSPISRIIEEFFVNKKLTGDLLLFDDYNQILKQYYEKAKNFYDKAVSIEPNNLKYLKSKSYLYIVIYQDTKDKKDILSAKEYIEKCIEIDPNDSESWFILSELKTILGNDKEAKQSYKKALELNPEIIEKMNRKIKIV